jgi:hypothetical protein
LYLGIYCDYVNADEADLAFERLQALSPGFPAKPRNLRSLLQRAENLLKAGEQRCPRPAGPAKASVRPMPALRNGAR